MYHTNIDYIFTLLNKFKGFESREYQFKTLKSNINLDNMDKKLIYNLLFSLFWAGSILSTKIALMQGMDPLIFNFQTTLLSVFVLVPYIVLLFKNDLKKINKTHIKVILLLGIILSFAYITSNLSLKLTSSINYGFLIKTTIVFTPLLSMIFLQEKITMKKIIFMFVFLVGAYLISTNGKTIIPALGDILVVITAFLFSSALITTKFLVGKFSPEFSGAIRPISAFIFLLIMTPMLSQNFTPSVILNTQSMKYVVLASIFGILLSIFLGKSAASSSASYFTLMNNMTSVFVLLGGLALLNETITMIQLLGATITIVSAIIVQKSNV